MSSVIHGSTLLRGLAALSLAGIGTGCADGQPKAGLGPNEEAVTSISLVSAASTIDAGQVVVVRAAGRTGAGQPASVAVDWSASGGSIVPVSDSEAQFSAAAAGSYTVVARGTAAPFPVDSTRFTVVQPVSPTVALSVTPASATLSPGGIRVFTATATRQDGSSYVPSVVWSATGGSVSGAGVYTAGSNPGSFIVVASQGGGALVDTAFVTISAPVLQAVILTPSSVSLNTGASQQFSVSGQWSNGSTTAPPVSYSATGGTITSGGVYTGGGAPGSYRVIATVQGGSLADTSQIILNTPPPPGPNPHEPAGMTLGFDEPFSVSPVGQPVSGWFVEDGGSLVSIVSDASAPVSPGSVLQLKFPAGMGGGNAPMRINWNESGHFPPNSGTLYMRMHVKISSDWSNNGNNMTKFIWPRPISETTAHFSPITWSGGGMQFGFALQGSYLNGVDHDYIEAGTHSKGVWHDVEWLLYQGSSGGANNGTIKVWVDGVQVVTETGVKYMFDGESPGWKYMTINPTFGGGTNPVPHDQYIWIDHWYASVK